MTRHAFFLLLGSILGFSVASCTCGNSGCTDSAQCTSGETCLPSGLCAKACSAQTDCLSTEKCSPSGGCVSVNGGCGVNADCPSGQVCQSGGTCGTGNGGTGGNSGNGGGNGGTGGAGGDCGETFTPTSVPANLMIVLDQSSSMMQDTTVRGVTKWQAAVDAVKKMTTTNSAIQFGLTRFPALGGNGCSVSGIEVPIGPNTAATIQAALPATAEGNHTPIGAGLNAAGKDPGLDDTTRSNGIVVVTDGNENCGGTPVPQVKALFARSNIVRTYVIGFGQGTNPTLLTNMAVEGGTARIVKPRYYQAEKQADLDEALKAISNSAQMCSFTLTKTGLDPKQIFVGINGQLVPWDKGHISGWDYDPTTNRVTLFGPACDALATTPNAQLKVNYGCPGDITEGGDGGFVFDLDAGQIG